MSHMLLMFMAGRNVAKHGEIYHRDPQMEVILAVLGT